MRPDVPFSEVWAPLLARVHRALAERLGGAHPVLACWPDIHACVQDRLVALAAPTLLFEFRLAQAARNPLELLEGPTGSGREAYDAFAADLLAGGWERLLARYPVLARNSGIVIAQAIDFFAEFALRLDEDRPALERHFGLPPGGPARLTLGLSDPHGGGRTVIDVQFAEGRRLVYKPRDGVMEEAWNGLLAWLNRRDPAFEQMTLQTLPRPGRVWVAHATAADCPDAAAVARFYRRSGRLLAVLYAIYGNDCHFENLVACGEHPVIVDPETFLMSEFYLSPEDRPTQATWEALHAYHRSVVMVGLLPVDDDLATGGPEPLYPIHGLAPAPPLSAREQLTWSNLNTDRMDLRYRRRPLAPAPNLPRVEGVVQRSEGFAAELVAGFTAQYRSLMACRDELLADDGPLGAFAGALGRYIVRASYIYDKLLKRLTLPALLADPAAYEAELALLARSFADVYPGSRAAALAVLAAEKSALERLDIPLFAVRVAETTLLADGVPLPGLIPASGLSRARARIAALGEDDLDRQLGVMRSALQAPMVRQSGPLASLPGSPASLLERASALGERLAARAAVGEGGGVCWTYPRRGAGARTHAAQDGGLYHGRLGTALFLAALAQVTGNPRAHDLAHGAADLVVRAGPLPDQLGLAVGLGGHVYGLETVGRLLNRPELCEAAWQAAEALDLALIGADAQLDVMSGSAGLALGLLALRAPGPVAAQALAACAEHLLACEAPTGGWLASLPEPIDRPLGGLSHGASGIALALARLSHALNHPAALAAARRGFAYEDRLFRAHPGDWADLRVGDRAADTRSVAAWCNGAAGIGLARLAAGPLGFDAAQATERAVAAIAAAPPTGGDTACCGEAGRIDFLLAAGHHAEARRRAASLGWQPTPDGWRHESHGAFCPSFFHGAAGVGYTLLRAIAPDRLPSVLLLARMPS